MVSAVLADTRQLVVDGNADFLEQSGRADAGELQQLRRVDGAARENDFAARADLDGFPAAHVLNADGALPLEDDLRRVGFRAYFDVRALEGGPN